RDLLLERVNVRPQRGDPVGRKRVGHERLLLAGEMRWGEIDAWRRHNDPSRGRPAPPRPPPPGPPPPTTAPPAPTTAHAPTVVPGIAALPTPMSAPSRMVTCPESRAPGATWTKSSRRPS